VTLILVGVTDDCLSVAWEAQFGMGYSEVRCLNSDSRHCVQDLERGKEAVEVGPTFDILPSDLSVGAETGEQESRQPVWGQQKRSRLLGNYEHLVWPDKMFVLLAKLEIRGRRQSGNEGGTWKWFHTPPLVKSVVRVCVRALVKGTAIWG